MPEAAALVKVLCNSLQLYSSTFPSSQHKSGGLILAHFALPCTSAFMCANKFDISENDPTLFPSFKNWFSSVEILTQGTFACISSLFEILQCSLNLGQFQLQQCCTKVLLLQWLGFLPELLKLLKLSLNCVIYLLIEPLEILLLMLCWSCSWPCIRHSLSDKKVHLENWWHRIWPVFCLQ